MSENDDGTGATDKVESTGTVALSGYMVGPSGDNYEFTLTHPLNPDKSITVTWADIRWIDSYPHPYHGEPGGDDSHHLGRRTIWLDKDADQIGQYLNGGIVEAYMPPGDNLAGWHGPEVMYGIGPQGSSYPPCLCPKKVTI